MLFSVILLILILCSIGWLIYITQEFRKLKSHYNALVEGSNKQTLEEVLRELLKDVSITKKDIAQLTKRCDILENNETFHIQKIGLLRFNPFNDTGGDQSFILTLSDARDTGVVITGLYSRTGTRWYAKKIIEGKGSEHDLSDDEKKALKTAKNIKEIH
jgi:hypothetical protein